MYGKIFKSMFEGTMRGKPDVLLVWTNFIANADKDGYVDRTFRTISEETGLTIESVEKAIIELESPDIESRSQELEGRRLERIDDHRNWGWRIVNYAKYSNMKNEEERREQNRLAQERFRVKKQLLKNEIVSNSKQLSSDVIKVSPLDVDVDVDVDVDTTTLALIEKTTFDFSTSKFVNLNSKIDKYKEKYPAIEVPAEILKMEAWLMSNPKNRKTNYERFINNWLSKAQDKARVVNDNKPEQKRYF